MDRSQPPYTRARETCQALMARSDLPAKVDREAASKLAETLDVAAVQAFGASLASDANFTGTACQFQSSTQEAAFIVLMHALDFGSGWRQELHRHHGKGAWLTVKPGIEALHGLAKGSYTAEWLCGLTAHQVAEAFAISDNPELESLVDALLLVLHDLGRGLQENQFTSLEAFVDAKIVESTTHRTPAGEFVWDLVETFPTTFNDQHMIDNQLVCFYKKAQLVTGEIYHRFHKEEARFNFIDGPQLTAYIDNVICATMRYTGVAVLSEELTHKIEHGAELEPSSVEEVSFRAAAMCGVDAVTEATGNRLTSSELGNYLWAGLGKEPKVRKFHRHATKTVFY